MGSEIRTEGKSNETPTLTGVMTMSREIMYRLPNNNAAESFLSLRDAMDRLFEDSFVWPRLLSREGAGFGGVAGMEMYETPDDVVVRMAVPGVKSDQVNIEFRDGHVVIDANAPEPKSENVTFHFRGIPHGQFHREVALPVEVETEKIEAVMEDGILTLTMPKAEELKPKKIQVKAKTK